MRWCLFFGMWLMGLTVLGQPTLVLPGKLPGPQLDIGRYTMFYEDISGDTLPLSVIRQKAFRPFNDKPNERATYSTVSVIVIWLRFTIRNTHPTDTLRCLHNPSFHGLTTWYLNGRWIGETGLALTPSPHQSPFMLPLSVPPQKEHTYYVRVIDYFHSPVPVTSTLFTWQGSYDSYFAWDLPIRTMRGLQTVLLGCLLFMFLYTLHSFTQTRDRLFLYYTLYALTCLLLILNALAYQHYFRPVFGRYISESIRPANLGLVTFWYTLFIARVIDLPAQFPRIWQILKILMVVLMIQEVHSVIEWVHGRPLFYTNWAYQYAMIPPNLTACILAWTIFRSRSLVRGYLLAGISSLLIIAFVPGTLEFYLSKLPPLADLLINNIAFWIELGLVVEAFWFLLALSRRGFLIEQEKNQMQTRYAHDLETQLVERTRQIEQQSRQLEAQHIRQLETEFEQKLADTEMTALRAQMNPHFIFNCLNSIKLYTLENDADRASNYLTKFSRLIRLVLENSRSELVTLHNELEALRLYIELEAMRFKNKLRYRISLSPDIDAQFVCIPPLLLQPYVENAIWHGLMHKPEGGTITIDVAQPQADILHIEITDDGVGRQRSAELKSKSAGRHKSFGMQVTADRIRMINQLYNMQAQAQLEDLVDSYGEACGTRVVLKIPV